MNSTDVRELYQQVILEHNRKPRNFKKLEPCTHHAEGFNPLCGDHLWVYADVDASGVLNEVSFEGQGCAISKSSASMMTAALKGKTEAEAKALFEQFHDLLLGKLKPEDPQNQLGKLNIFSGIWEYPSRVKCAALSWHTLKNALERKEIASTE